MLISCCGESIMVPNRLLKIDILLHSRDCISPFFFFTSLNVVMFVFTQNVVSRVSNLTLVSSACEVVSSAYTSTKESMPMLKGVMDAAESGVRTLGAAATTGSKPLLDIMEPQRRFFPLCKR